MNLKSIINDLVLRVDAEGLPIEAVSAYQGDRFVVSHRWKADVPRNIYSHTKSFTSTAVGIAVQEGRLSLEDKPAEFFPEALPDQPHPGWADVRLKDLLVMGMGVDKSLLMSSDRRAGVGSPDYAAYIFSHDIVDVPGTRFLYSNANTYLAGRMVEKAVGQDLAEFLEDRLFAPLEISAPRWERCPQMHPFGAGGMWLRTEDMLKLGRLYQKGGVWNGIRLVDSDWIDLATTKKLDTPPSENGTGLSCGYGYQFWMCPYSGAYRADGMYCQYTVVFPKSEVVIGVQTSEHAPEITDRVQLALHAAFSEIDAQ